MRYAVQVYNGDTESYDTVVSTWHYPFAQELAWFLSTHDGFDTRVINEPWDLKGFAFNCPN